MPSRRRLKSTRRPVPEGQSSDDASETEKLEVPEVTSATSNPFWSSRLEEKEELQWLNDRLANYIEFIQQNLVSPGGTGEASLVTDSLKSKLEDLGSMYNEELDAVRRNLDEIALRLAKTEVELKSVSSHREEVLSDLNASKTREAHATNKIADLSERLAALEKELASCRNAQSDLVILEKQHKVLKKQLEEETLLRTDLQNRLHTLTEQLDFKDKLLASEREAFSKEALEIHAKVASSEAEKYRHKLKLKLDDLRLELNKQMKDLFAKFQRNAQVNIDAEKQRASEAENRAQANKDECDRIGALLQSRTAELNRSRSELDVLRRQIDQLNLALGANETKQRNLVEKQREELKRLVELLDEKCRECAGLAGIKIQLDAEIAMYRSLLESEESRCRLSVSDRRKLTAKPLIKHSQKRTATHFETSVDLDDTPVVPQIMTPTQQRRHERFTHPSGRDSSVRITCTADGPIHFAGADPANGLVRIFNATDESINLDHWRLLFGPTNPGGTDDTLLYTFTDGHIVPPHSEILMHLCSASGDQVDLATTNKKQRLSSPTIFVVTDAPIWQPYDSAITLLDTEGCICSVCEIKPAGQYTPTSSGLANVTNHRDSFRITCKADGPVYFDVPESGRSMLSIRNAGDEPLDLTGWYILFETKRYRTRHVVTPNTSLDPGSEIRIYLSGLHQKQPSQTALWLQTDIPVEEHYDSTFTLYDAEDQVRATSRWESIDQSDLLLKFPDLGEAPLLNRSSKRSVGGNADLCLPAVDRYRNYVIMNPRNRNGICSCPLM